MPERQSVSKETQSRKGGKILSALCGTVGTALILAIILLLLPLSVPRLFGLQVFNVVSNSMSPTIPVGSMVIVRPVDATEIREGDVIAFGANGVVVTHRVVRIHSEEREFVTKGDANSDEDLSPVSYFNLIGRVERHIPLMGNIAATISTGTGKAYLLGILSVGVLLRTLSGRRKTAGTGGGNE